MGVKRQPGDVESKPLLNPSVHQSSIIPLQFYNPTSRVNSDNGISKFANLKSYFVSSVSCSGQSFTKGCGDFSPKVSPTRLWFNANLWSSVEEGEKLECDTKV